jgi:hypothetical protein
MVGREAERLSPESMNEGSVQRKELELLIDPAHHCGELFFGHHRGAAHRDDFDGILAGDLAQMHNELLLRAVEFMEFIIRHLAHVTYLDVKKGV